ncbi:MAG: heat-inducible transcription repressor HrcA [Oscillospiraceae bacterium]|jgi:heat-inducible transcriptional repressor|nr:heat-inducible transcription repressor HrcA [Oscillospiraceae bacterium]
MALLEKLGFIEQPHTSAGRVPSYLGYRLYIEKLMVQKPLTQEEKELIDSFLLQKNLTAEAVVGSAAEALAELTGYATINMSAMPQFSVITRVEVVPAGRRLYALLIITSVGEVKNKICRVEFDLNYEQLDFFAKFINKNLYGIKTQNLNPAFIQNLAVALGSYMMSLSPLLYAVYELSGEFLHRDVGIKGETNLLTYKDFDASEIIKFISSKNELANLLNSAFDGINIIFGKENDNFAITNSSLILSQYSMGNANVGSLGVIGPIRLDYAKIIPYIEYFSNGISNALSQMIEQDDEKGD